MRPAVLLLLAVVARAVLILAYPPIFGDDSVTRLVYHHVIPIAHQLPALQAGIWLLGGDATAVRCLMVAIGAVAAVGFYCLAADLLGADLAFPAVLLFATHPFILVQSLVPYEEILMLAALSFGFHYFFAQRYAVAGAFIGLACLTRYEAWAAAAILAVACWRAGNWTLPALARAVALFGWAPLAWILYNQGLSPEGTFVLESKFSLERLLRWPYLGWITLKYTPVPVLLLAALGVGRLFRQRLLAGPRWTVLFRFSMLFLAAILFSAHGVTERPERFVTVREAHLPMAAVLCLAGLGLGRLPRYRSWLVAAAVALGLYGSVRYLAEETSRSDTRLGYELGRYLDRTLGPNDRALILVRPVPAQRFQAYLDRAERQGGAAARAKAQRVLDQVGSTAPDYQRTAVHSRLARERLLAHLDPAAPPPEWLVVWSDFAPSDPATAAFHEQVSSAGPPLRTLTAGSLSAAVYRTRP